MKELIISEFGIKLRKRSGRIQVWKDKEMLVETPFDDLENLLIVSNGVGFTSDLVRELVEADVLISFLDFSGKPWAKVVTPLHLADVNIRFEQLMARNQSRGAELARQFVYGKISDQLGLLESLTPRGFTEQNSIAGLLSSLEQVKGKNISEIRPKLLGIEARAASYYWSGFSRCLPGEFDFGGREKRGAADPVNVALNYGYGILYSRIWSALYRAHLDPFIGYLHKDKTNRPGLVVDFMEEFRQVAVDYPLLNWLTENEVIVEKGRLNEKTRKKLAEMFISGLHRKYNYRNKKWKMMDIILMEAREVAGFLSGKNERTGYKHQWI